MSDTHGEAPKDAGDKPEEPQEERAAFSAVPKDEPPQEAEPAPAAKRRRGRMEGAEGALGWFILWLLAAAGGALLVIYWPWVAGTGPDDQAMADRLSALETRVGQLASGKAPEAAAATFEDLQRKVSGLKDRLDADEARLGAVEKAGGGNVDVSALKDALTKNSQKIAVLSQQVEQLGQAAPANGTHAAQPAANPQLGQKVAANANALAAQQKTLESLRSDLDGRLKAAGDSLDKLGGRIATLEQALPQLKQQVEATDQKVSALEQAQPQQQQQLAAMEARVAQLEKTAPPADLAQRLDSFALKSGVAALESRLQRLEDQDVAGLMRQAASMLALADLVRATEREDPFADELDALKALLPNSPQVKDLARYAKAGVPTIQTLAARFRDKADAIIAAERSAQAHNWAEKAWADFVNLVSIRRVGDVKGNDTGARVARAEFDLDHGNLAGAVHAVQGLDAPARRAAADWLADAKARLAVTTDAKVLTAKIVAALASAQAKRDSAVPPAVQPAAAQPQSQPQTQPEAPAPQPPSPDKTGTPQ